MSVLNWKHCPLCGNRLMSVGDADNPHVSCGACGFVQYDNPLPTTLAMIVRDRRVLLVQRAQEPMRGSWDTVGGFLNASETAEEGTIREVREELGCQVASLKPLGTYASVYGNTGRHTIGIAFICELIPNAEVRLSDENGEYAWFGFDEVPQLAFKDGRDAMEALIARFTPPQPFSPRRAPPNYSEV